MHNLNVHISIVIIEGISINQSIKKDGEELFKTIIANTHG